MGEMTLEDYSELVKVREAVAIKLREEVGDVIGQGRTVALE